MAYTAINGSKIYYEIKGDGEPLLLLHGNTASSRMFESVIEEYAKEFQLILVDFPGHGNSGRVEKFETDFWYYNAEICKEILAFLNLEKVNVIGTSGGALVAINLALEHPNRIKRIVADSFEGEFPLKSYIEAVENERAEGKKNAFAKAFWQNNHGSDWEKVVDLDTEMLINFSRLNRSFFHKPISELTIPTLLTGSREDEFCDHLDIIYSKLKSKNNKLEIHLFEKGGHPAMLSNAMEFFELIKQKI